MSVYPVRVHRCHRAIWQAPVIITLSDENRQRFLDAGLHKAVLSILNLYSSADISSLSLDDFKVAKTAVGVILNSCLGYGTYHDLSNLSIS